MRARLAATIPALAAALTFWAGSPATAQLPETDIYLAELSTGAAGLAIGTPARLISRPGYDNQPWFLRDGSGLLYTADAGGQTDVFRYDFATGRATRVTATPENEFSPSFLEDGTLLTVRWAADMSDGHLWLHAPDGTPLRVAPGDVPRVGYYARADDRTYAIFVNDSAQTFVLSDRITGEVVEVTERSGGSPPQNIPGQRAVSLFQPDTAGDWWIVRLDLDTRAITPLVRALPDNTHYAWTPGGALLMASGSSIYAFVPGRDEAWRLLADFDVPELGDISRIAVSPAGDRIAFVAGPRPPD